ncbi:MAG: hypothetical protein ACK4UO_08145 [Pseudolabrys sp.]
MLASLLRLTVIACVIGAAAPALAQVSPQAIAEYRTKLAAYEKARAAYDAVAEPYWDSIADKRRQRNAKRREHIPIVLEDYVLTHPPVYSGPPRPVDPQAPHRPPEPPIPLIADFLKAAAEEFGFVPNRPASDAEFKRAYARAAAAAGLTKEQIVGVYAFETGGNGTYDMQSGVTPTRPVAVSPAVGYNQLLSTNTVSLLSEFGERYLAALRMKAAPLRGEARRQMDRRIEAFKRMIAYARSVPHRWAEQDKLAKTTKGGWGIHAAVLDIDLGPMLQVQKLTQSVQFAKMKGYAKPLTPAELELMNLTGDGNGFDMVTMPQALREKVPTANFFQQRGYERNPVARRTGTVAGLIAHMEGLMTRAAQAPGARELAAAF